MAGSSANFAVLLLDEHDFFGHSVATCLGQISGIKLHVLSRSRRPTVRYSRFVTSFHTQASANDTDRLEEIIRLVQLIRADVVLPVAELGIHLLNQNRERFKNLVSFPPLPTPDLFETVVNKYSLARWLNQAEIQPLETLLLTDIETIQQDLSQLRFPVLLKPIFGGDGAGIYRFKTANELISTIRACPPPPGTHILQSYIPGRDVDCSVLCRDGEILAYTIQVSAKSRKNPFAVDKSIRFTHHSRAFTLIKRTMAGLRWNGIAHLDMREDERDNSLHIIDFNPRFWATLLGSLAAGVNFPHLTCLAALKHEFPQPDFRLINYTSASVALRRFLIGEKLRFKTGLPYALKDPLPRVMNQIKRIHHRWRS